MRWLGPLDRAAPPGCPQHPLYAEVVLDFEPSGHGAACRVARHRLEGGGGHGKNVVQADGSLQRGSLAGPASGGDAEGEFRGDSGTGDKTVWLSRWGGRIVTTRAVLGVPRPTASVEDPRPGADAESRAPRPPLIQGHPDGGVQRMAGLPPPVSGLHGAVRCAEGPVPKAGSGPTRSVGSGVPPRAEPLVCDRIRRAGPSGGVLEPEGPRVLLQGPGGWVLRSRHPANPGGEGLLRSDPAEGQSAHEQAGQPEDMGLLQGHRIRRTGCSTRTGIPPSVVASSRTA